MKRAVGKVRGPAGQRRTREPARTTGWISRVAGPRSGRLLAFGTSAPPWS